MAAGVTFLRILLVVVQTLMTLSPGIDICKVCKNKSTGEMLVYPLVSMAGTNYVWALYAYLTSSIFPLFCASVFAMLAGITYTAVYFRWTTDRLYVLKPCVIAFIGCGLATVYMVQGLAGVGGQTKTQVTDVLGYLGDALSICMFASPLESAWHVIRTKSSASVPINFSVMMLAATGLWVAVALIDNDLFVLVPNALGVAFSIMQIVLYFLYRQKRPQNFTAMEELNMTGDSQFVIVVSPKEDGESPACKSLATPFTPSATESRSAVCA